MEEDKIIEINAKQIDAYDIENKYMCGGIDTKCAMCGEVYDVSCDHECSQQLTFEQDIDSNSD